MKPDVNEISFADGVGRDLGGALLLNRRLKPSSAEVSDTVKFSNWDDGLVLGCTIDGGNEDCIDMNRGCSRLDVVQSTLRPWGNFGITIKGGSNDILIADVVFESHGSEADIDLGNFAHTGNGRVRNVTLDNVTSTDGKPVKVRVLNADTPVIFGGNVKVVKVWPPLWKGYFLFRRFQLWLEAKFSR